MKSTATWVASVNEASSSLTRAELAGKVRRVIELERPRRILDPLTVLQDDMPIVVVQVTPAAASEVAA